MLTLHASWSPGELRVVAWDGRLIDYAISRDSGPDDVGALHRGRIIARVPAMAGSFVALANAEGFLPDSEGGGAGDGTLIGIRITRTAQAGKGPRLSARLSESDQALIGQGPPAKLRQGPDALDRLIALHSQAMVLMDDVEAARGRATRITPRAFTGEIEAEIASLAEPVAGLPNGGSMSVYPTPALVAIDIDLGSATAERSSKSIAQSRANHTMLPELCRQIRLRNLSGAILVDLGGMALRKRASLAPAFTQALASDPLAPRFLGFSALGLAEILRPRIHPPLHELLAGPHAAALTALRAVLRERSTNPAANPTLHATPTIAAALHADATALAALAQRTGRDLIITEDRSLPAPGWRLQELARG